MNVLNPELTPESQTPVSNSSTWVPRKPSNPTHTNLMQLHPWSLFLSYWMMAPHQCNCYAKSWNAPQTPFSPRYGDIHFDPSPWNLYCHFLSSGLFQMHHCNRLLTCSLSSLQSIPNADIRVGFLECKSDPVSTLIRLLWCSQNRQVIIRTSSTHHDLNSANLSQLLSPLPPIRPIFFPY